MASKGTRVSTVFKKTPGRARSDGIVYESNFAALVYLRLCALRRTHQKLSLTFDIWSNVEKAWPFDDMVVRIEWTERSKRRNIMYLISLKQGVNAGKVVSKEQLIKSEGKMSLKKLSDSCRNLLCLHSKSNPDHEDKDMANTALQDWRFVWYTTSKILPNKKSNKNSSYLEFPFEHIFSSNQGDYFSLGNSDTEIWNLLQGHNYENTYQSHFLPKLRIFSDQTPANKMEPCISEALKCVIGGQVPHQTWNNSLHSYLKSIREWRENRRGIALSENSPQMQDALCKIITENVTLIKLDFTRNDELSEWLHKHSFCCAVVPGICKQLRCSQVLGILDENRKNDPGNKDLRYFVITAHSFQQFKPDDIVCHCLEFRGSMLINMDEEDANIFVPFIEKIISSNVLTSNTLFKMIVVTPARIVEIEKLLPTPDSERVDHWKLSHLSGNEQVQLLQRTIVFDRYQIPLISLEKSWPSLREDIDPEILDALIMRRPVLGSSLPSPLAGYIDKRRDHLPSERDNAPLMARANDSPEGILKQDSINNCRKRSGGALVLPGRVLRRRCDDCMGQTKLIHEKAIQKTMCSAQNSDDVQRNTTICPWATVSLQRGSSPPCLLTSTNHVQMTDLLQNALDKGTEYFTRGANKLPEENRGNTVSPVEQCPVLPLSMRYDHRYLTEEWGDNASRPEKEMLQEVVGWLVRVILTSVTRTRRNTCEVPKYIRMLSRALEDAALSFFPDSSEENLSKGTAHVNAEDHRRDNSAQAVPRPGQWKASRGNILVGVGRELRDFHHQLHLQTPAQVSPIALERGAHPNTVLRPVYILPLQLPSRIRQSQALLCPLLPVIWEETEI